MKSFRTHLMAVALSTVLLTFANAGGNVEVEVNNGNLRLRGANNTNQQIVISATNVAGQFLLESLDATTFNGAANGFVNGIFGDVRVDLGSGEKLLAMTEDAQVSLRILGDLNINSKGNFPVQLFLDDLEVDGSTSIKTKNGDDIVFMIGGLYGGPVIVNTSNGHDLFGTDAGSSGFVQYSDDLVMKMGKGDDFALVFNSDVLGQADFQMGSGNDGAVINSSEFLGAVPVKGSNGFDRFAEEFSIFLQPPTFSSVEDFNADIDSILDDASNTTLLDEAVLFFFIFFG